MSAPAPKSETTVPALLDPDRMDYRPAARVHLAQAGRVALSNWVGRVGNRRVRVYRGAQAGKIPKAVQDAMLASGVEIGIITLADLGLKSLPGGDRVISVTSGSSSSEG